MDTCIQELIVSTYLFSVGSIDLPCFLKICDFLYQGLIFFIYDTLLLKTISVDKHLTPLTCNGLTLVFDRPVLYGNVALDLK